MTADGRHNAVANPSLQGAGGLAIDSGGRAERNAINHAQPHGFCNAAPPRTPGDGLQPLALQPRLTTQGAALAKLGHAG